MAGSRSELLRGTLRCSAFSMHGEGHFRGWHKYLPLKSTDRAENFALHVIQICLPPFALGGFTGINKNRIGK